MFDRISDFATTTLDRLLIRAGLDPSNITYEAIFSRLFDLLLANITMPNLMFLVGGIFLILTFMVRTIVLMRWLTIVSIVFFLGAAALSGLVPNFLMYLLALPVNVVRLMQIRSLVKRARSSAEGTLSLDWLRPYMTPRGYEKGDLLFRKGDVADEMFLTVSGRFLVTEIGVELPADRILGELGFLSPNNIRTQSVECIESGEVLTITYEKLLEIYMENPEFGYYFLRLTSDRLLQNHARVQALVDQATAELAAAKAALARGEDDAVSAGFRRFTSFARLAGRRLSGEDFEIESLFAKPDAEATHRRLIAVATVSRYSNYAIAGGFIPVPYVNEATMIAVNMRMVKALYQLYDKPFDVNRAHSLVAGLVAGAIPARLATVAGFVPGVHVLGLAVASVTAAVISRRLGHKLIEHFEREAAIERDRRALEEFRRANVWFRRWGRTSRAVLVYGFDVARGRRGEERDQVGAA